jgi:hypothetical protein
MAETDHLLVRRAFGVRLAEDRHRVGVVEQPRVRRDRREVLADPEQHGDRAQRAEDPADAERVADRLAQPVAGGQLEVEHRRLVHADLDHVDGEVGAVERRPPLRVGGDARPRPELLVEPVRQRGGGLQPLGVDVVQRELEPAQVLVGEEVAEQLTGERGAARADEGHFGHSAALYS